MIKLSDFEVDDILPLEAKLLVFEATSNEILDADVEQEMIALAPERPLVALVYAHYGYSKILDGPEGLEVIRVLKIHLNGSSPSLVAAVALMIADVDEWIGASRLPEGNRGLQAEMLELSTALRPDWVTNWLYLFGLRVRGRDWPGAKECLDRLSLVPPFNGSDLDPVSVAFEMVFTGRPNWTVGRTVELRKELAYKRRKDFFPSLFRARVGTSGR